MKLKLKNYHHVFFDLDHTLWDYDKNVEESLEEIYCDFKLRNLGVLTFVEFLTAFKMTTNELWQLFNLGKIDKKQLKAVRFRKIFEAVGADCLNIPLALENEFSLRTSSKSNLLPDSIEILTYLKENYGLHIITNGFNESQYIKLKVSGLESFFNLVVTSETTGYKKPDKRIFQHAIKKLGTSSENCIMVGDNPLSDILGAQNAGIDQVFFNPLCIECELTPTYSIQSLKELRAIL